MSWWRKNLASFAQRLAGEDAAHSAPGSPGSKTSVRTKILLMMLLPSLLSLGVITYLASREGKTALTEAAFNQLTSYRAAKKQQIEWYFRNLTETFSVLGTDGGIVQAFSDLNAGFASVGQVPLSPQRTDKLLEYYRQNVLPSIADEEGNLPALEDVFPVEPAALELQALYISENVNGTKQKQKLVNHTEVNPYTTAHAKHHVWLRNLMNRIGYYDIFLIDGETGDVVYTVTKETDLGMNVLKGNLARTHLAKLVRDVIEARRRNLVRMTDFEVYRFSGGPHAFLATPIFSGTKFVGVIAAQISTDAMNRFIHNGRHWAESGLGKTGSAYLASLKDGTMRSDAREILENPDAYIEKLARSKAFPTSVIESIRRDKTTILHYPVNPEPLIEARKGYDGTITIPSRKGGNVLISFAPLNIPDVQWAVLTRMDEGEVLAGQIKFNRIVLTVGCMLAFATTLAALGLARIFLKPVDALLAGIQRLRDGQRAVSIEGTSRDEFGELVGAFNAMSAEIQHRDEVIESKNKAYLQLLKRIFPETVADRLRQGDADISESFSQVTVIYAIVDGLAVHSEDADAKDSTKILNELVDAFDNAAEQMGVEKVKTIGDHYLAVCGLDVARLDHAARSVDFAAALYKEIVVARRTHGLDLNLRAGIATGPVRAGLVGNRRFVYDIWGVAAKIAQRIVYEADFNAARLNVEAYEAISDKSAFGDELDVKTKALGAIKTYQYRLGQSELGGKKPSSAIKAAE